jgi:hypothetical protein
MIEQTSSNIHQTQGRGTFARFRHQPAGSVKLVGATVIAVLAGANNFANAAENSSRIAQEHHACAVVLGLDPSDRQYDTCITSLDRSLTEWDQAQAVQTDRHACAEKGLEPGTAAFAVCVVDAGQPSTNAHGYGTVTPVR